MSRGSGWCGWPAMLGLLWLAVATAPPLSAGETVYVAPEGEESASGDRQDPFGSVVQARDFVRSERKNGRLSGSVTVRIASGTYRFEEPFVLTENDSGSPEGSIAYAAEEQGEARFLGGERLSGFQDVASQAILERLPAKARPHVKVIDLAAHGINDFGKLMPRGFGGHGEAALELFFGGKPMTLARWPNDGWMTIAGLPGGKEGRRIAYRGDRPRRWADAESPWLFGYWYHGWADQFLPVKSIAPQKQEITLGEQHHYGLRKGQRFFALNLLEEIDEPGEWYLNRETGMLYFWPPGSLKTNEVVVSMMDEPLVRVKGASYLRLEGLDFEAGRDNGIVIGDSDHVTIEGCAVRNVGEDAIRIEGGQSNRVVACEVGYPGESGIALSGGDRSNLEPGNHEAVDNHIHHFGRKRRTYQPAVQLSGVGNRVAHNHIHHAPHMAIGFGGNDHVIERNEIHHVLLETDDAGAMYIGRDWTERGHVIRYNFLHHCGNRYKPKVPESERDHPHVVYEPLHRHGINLLYFDDCASGITAVGNILHGAGRAIMIGGGRDHFVKNNLVIGGRIGVWIDARGVGWASDHIAKGGGWRMYEKLAEVDYQSPPYSERYPELTSILEEAPHKPRGNVVRQNIFIGVDDWKRFQGSVDKKAARFVKNVELSELPTDEPAATVKRLPKETMRQIGFQPISIDEIGPRKDSGH